MSIFSENLIEFLLKIVPLLLSAFVGFLFGVLKDHKNTIFHKKLVVYSEIISNINKHEYASWEFDEAELIDLFSQARLLGSKKLEFLLREYYTLVTEYKNAESDMVKEMKSDEISEIVMNIEQVMRAELGNRRILSSKEILKHVYD